MKKLIKLFEEFRSAEGLSTLVSREFSDNESTPTFELIKSLRENHPAIIDFLLFSSCSLMKDLWEILISDHEYMQFIDKKIMTNGLIYFDFLKLQISNNIKTEDLDSIVTVNIPLLKVRNEQFQFVSSLNSYFEETLNYLKKEDPCLSAAISLSMFSEYFSNCGVREYGHVDTEWIYSYELLNYCSRIADQNLKGVELLNFCSKCMPKIDVNKIGPRVLVYPDLNN